MLWYILIGYVLLSFTMASLILRFQEEPGDPNPEVDFFMWMLFWPIGAIYVILFLPIKAFQLYARMLAKR